MPKVFLYFKYSTAQHCENISTGIKKLFKYQFIVDSAVNSLNQTLTSLNNLFITFVNSYKDLIRVFKSHKIFRRLKKAFASAG